jgi:hypothetical protein
MVYAPPNALICGIAQITKNDADVMGNVLVVKHIQGNKHNIVDCTEDDVKPINTIFSRSVGTSTSPN